MGQSHVHKVYSLEQRSYLLLTQVVGEVGDHNLVLGGNPIFRRSSLTGLTWSTGLRFPIGGSFARCLICGVGQRQYLAGHIGIFCSIGLTLRGKWLATSSCKARDEAYATSSTARATSTTTAASTPTSRVATTASLVAATFGTAGGSGLLLGSSLRLACQLNRDLTLQDEFASKLLDGFLGFVGSREVNEGIANWSGGTRIGRDRRGLARCTGSAGRK